MYIFINLGESEKADRNTVLKCKGIPKWRRKIIEKMAWNTNIPF